MSIILNELVNFYEVKYKDRALSHLKKFAKLFEVLDWSIPVITVTGTNGKGSTVAALSKIYQLNGYQVGVFTSPHLLSMHERIRINQTLITTEQINEITKSLMSYQDFQHFTWFEISFLIALVFFKQKNIDVMVLEVGVGGTFDATNIIDADLVIITNVDFDHQDYLGDTLEEIGFQKAGLFRPQHRAIFASDACPKTVLKHALDLSVDLKKLNQDFSYEIHDQAWTLRLESKIYHFPQLPSIHLSAMSAAIYASELLNHQLVIDKRLWPKAIEEVFIPGRFQKIETKNLLILDVGHNPHAAKLLVERLLSLNIKGKIHLIISFLKDKDGKKTVKILKKMPFLCYPCVLDSERATQASHLQKLFPGNHIFDSPESALQMAREQAKDGDVIVAFGSFSLVAPLMNKLMKEGVDVFRNHRTN